MVDYYDVLGVKHTASVKEIKAAYKRLARLRHPDLNGGSSEAARSFVEISSARDVLLDPRRRAEYDAQRQAHAARGAHAPIVKPTVETYARRARSDARINQNLENFLTIERAEARALRRSVLTIVALLLGAFFVPLLRPHFWRSSGWPGRVVIFTLVCLGIWHTVSRVWTLIKLHPDDDQTGDAVGDEPIFGSWSRGQTIAFIGMAAIGCGLLGTLIGVSLSDSLLIAMPMFFDRSMRPELLLYPWIMVLLIDAGHSLSQRLDI